MRALAIFGMVLAVLGAPGQAVAQFSLQGSPFGKIEPGVGEPGGMGRPVQAAPGLENARIYQLGALGTPGRWEVRGDGSGPIVVGGDVYVPGGPGQRGRFVETGTSLDARVIGTSGAPAPAEKFRTSREILDEVDRKRRAKDALSGEGALETAAPAPPLVLRDLSALPPPKLAELADARDASTRGSALAALEARARGEAEPRASLAARKAAVRAMLAALDDEDLRVVRVAAAALGRLRALAAQEKLLALLNLEDTATVVSAIEARAAMGAGRALPALEQLAAADEGALAGAAARALATLRAAPGARDGTR
ncbi:MAG: hypothetical protein HYY25_05215 [Candidatus Wallbacteria bacterium]|nr:hypothetical protein [Candidatus Wallbacteria bacterium]